MIVVLYVRIWPRDGFGGLAGARVEESAEPRRHIKILNGFVARRTYYGRLNVQRQVPDGEREENVGSGSGLHRPLTTIHSLQKQWASSSTHR